MIFLEHWFKPHCSNKLKNHQVSNSCFSGLSLIWTVYYVANEGVSKC